MTGQIIVVGAANLVALITAGILFRPPTEGVGPSTRPPTTSVATLPCPVVRYSWDRILATNARGEYQVPLARCESLWFNSGGVTVNGTRLGGNITEQNTVLIFQATEPTTVDVRVGDPQDRGNDWLAVSKSDFDSIIAAWTESALRVPNCRTGCSYLAIYHCRDGIFLPPATRVP